MNNANYRYEFKFGLKDKVTIRQISIRGRVFGCEKKADGNWYGVRFFSDSGDYMTIYYPEEELEAVEDDN